MLLESEQSILISNKLLPVYEDFIAPGHKVIRGNDDLNELLLLDDWLTPKVVLIAPRAAGSGFSNVIESNNGASGKSIPSEFI